MSEGGGSVISVGVGEGRLNETDAVVDSDVIEGRGSGGVVKAFSPQGMSR